MSGHTHVCIICWRRMNVTRDWKRNGAFITTVPNAHNRKYATGPDEINKVVVLRMNRAFMKYMRLHHPEASQQHFNMAVLKPDDNDEEDAVVSGEGSGGDSEEDSGVDSEEEEQEPGVAV